MGLIPQFDTIVRKICEIQGNGQHGHAHRGTRQILRNRYYKEEKRLMGKGQTKSLSQSEAGRGKLNKRGCA